MNLENGLFRQSKACEDAEARIKSLLFSFSPFRLFLEGSAGRCFHNSFSLCCELAENSGKKAIKDGNKYLFTWITVFKSSINIFQPPQKGVSITMAASYRLFQPDEYHAADFKHNIRPFTPLLS